MQGASEVLPQKPVSKPVIWCKDSGVSEPTSLGQLSTSSAGVEHWPQGWVDDEDLVSAPRARNQGDFHCWRTLGKIRARQAPVSPASNLGDSWPCPGSSTLQR